MLFIFIHKVNITKFCKLLPYTHSLLLANFHIYQGRRCLSPSLAQLYKSSEIQEVYITYFKNKVYQKKKNIIATVDVLLCLSVI